MTQVIKYNKTGESFNSAIFGSFTLYYAGMVLAPVCLSPSDFKTAGKQKS
jgi:hypothetical protein